MTHIENIPHIIENGITHKESAQSNQNYKPIGDNSLISTRDTYVMPNGNVLGDYIPFYFGARTPMLYVIQNGYNGVTALHPGKIVYCVSSIRRIIDSGIDFVYTDGHATDGFTKFYVKGDINNIENHVDFGATKAKFWKNENDLDLKRRKEAEFLIKQNLTYLDVIGFVVFNNEAQERLLEFGIPENKLVVKPDLYF
tara:strand:+ start:266 stop:856 length:591 start_codon:yes stop_codon:yes gene_type:complete